MSSSAIAVKSSFTKFPNYQRLFLKILEPLKLGQLKLTLPSGQQIIYGSESGSEYSASIHVRSENFFKRCILFGDIGFGEAYTEGEWDTDDITHVIRWMILNRENNPGISGAKASKFILGCLKILNRIQHLRRDNDLQGSVKNISAHYDLGNKFFETFLDPSLTYSCADFSLGASTLFEAQIAKLDRLAKAIQVRPGDHVLEIGGGWGAFAIHLAKNYGAKVTTITVSKEQYEKMNERIREARLSDKIEVKFLDYRKVDGKFDKIVSVEMLEAVGHEHLNSFFEVAERVLKQDGLMGVQVITSADCRYDELRKSVDWIQKHIFPGSLIPSVSALIEASKANSRLQLHSLFDMGVDYATTLRLWREQFNRSLDEIKEQGFDDRFIRAWNYYFSYCEAAFIERHISTVQMVFTRPNNTKIRSQAKGV